MLIHLIAYLLLLIYILHLLFSCYYYCCLFYQKKRKKIIIKNIFQANKLLLICLFVAAYKDLRRIKSSGSLSLSKDRLLWIALFVPSRVQRCVPIFILCFAYCTAYLLSLFIIWLILFIIMSLLSVFICLLFSFKF